MPEARRVEGSARRPSGSREVTSSVKRRILFVDDERDILEGLKSALRSQRHQWDMTFALGGPAALAALEESSFDVILTDMRMPLVDGAGVLAKAKEWHPRAARIVLSGQTDREGALRTAFAAHQFLAKPCEVTVLCKIIERTCRLTALVQDERLRNLAGDVASLPPAPGAFLALTRVMAQPHSSIADAARVVESDPALAAKLLQVVNSAFFGLPRRVTNVHEAVTFVGTMMLKNLALALEGLKPPRRHGISSSALEAIRKHSLHTALVARAIAKTVGSPPDDAFVAGMLHDVGVLLLPLDGPVREEHAHVGGYLLGLWGLPHSVVEAVAHHHTREAIERLVPKVPETVEVVSWAERLTRPYHALPDLDGNDEPSATSGPSAAPEAWPDFERLAAESFACMPAV